MKAETSERENDFNFRRERGIVWVCDVIGSTKHLNDNKSASAIERFLPRFHWLAAHITKAAGGEFINWTGDGFISWFPVSLHRELPEIAQVVTQAAHQTTMLINVTKLGIESPRPIQVRHGITYEQDALFSTITDSMGHRSVDVIGRGVVLAFRLSSLPASYPNIVTHRPIVNALGAATKRSPLVSFSKRKLTSKEVLQYLKGERWESSAIYISVEKNKPIKSLDNFVRSSKRLINKVEDRKETGRSDRSEDFISRLVNFLNNGPQWAKECRNQYIKWIHSDLLGSLKTVVQFLESLPRKK